VVADAVEIEPVSASNSLLQAGKQGIIAKLARFLWLEGLGVDIASATTLKRPALVHPDRSSEAGAHGAAEPDSIVKDDIAPPAAISVCRQALRRIPGFSCRKTVFANHEVSEQRWRRPS
jgi:hypothetical protein